ncbi:MAG: S-layer protein [Candidatus Methanofastidiosia archaeon]
MRGILLLLVLLLGTAGENTRIPDSFFVTAQGDQNCLIVVGVEADAADIVEASRLAAVIGDISSRRKETPVVREIKVSYENVGLGSCIVVTPQELPTLWWFDDFGVYGNGNGTFQKWETHEEIQLSIEDIPVADPFLGVPMGNGYLDFSTIYRIDNVRSPPYLMVDSYTEGTRGDHVTGLHIEDTYRYIIVDPYFVYYGYLPEVCIFDTGYKVVYIDSSVLITGEPHLQYVYLYKDTPFKAGSFTISLLDVDVDHNKCYLKVEGPQFRELFWMGLDPLHGFSPDLQDMGSEPVGVDTDNDGIPDQYFKTLTGRSELDVWGHPLFSFSQVRYQIADLVIDGIKIFVGETVGVYMGFYWVENVTIWPEKTCCTPFVKYPQEYDFQIGPYTVVAESADDAYVDEGLPAVNFGGVPVLSVRSFLNANARSFVRFNLPVLPQKALIEKAILRLVPVSPLVPRMYEMATVTGNWSESTITWASQPGAIATGTQITNAMEWDVTADVQDFYSGAPNYGWRISDQTENSVIPYEIMFSSREGLVKPQLILYYTFDCNYPGEVVPHIQNWVGTYYDDVDNNGIVDNLYEIDMRLCKPVRTVCNPLFFEGPNYYYFVDFLDVSFKSGVDFIVYQTERVGTHIVHEKKVSTWELLKLDSEVSEEDAEYNWILVGGMHANIWVKKIVDARMMPDDGSLVDWFVYTPGYKMYSDPFGYGNKILVVAGKTARDTQKAIRMLIDVIRES